MIFMHSDNLNGYLNFRGLVDGNIEMELMEDYQNDFAIVDVFTAEKIGELVMADLRTMPLKAKCADLNIPWLT